MSVKNIVTNVAALKSKYGANYVIIQAAIPPLIASDRAKGIITTVYDVSDPVQMAKVNAPVVTDKTSAQQFKATFDAIVNNTNPNYSMLLGAADIVPLVPIVNPMSGPDDPDPIAPSDLPYACTAGYSTSANDFLAPSRIVTRLPDVTGGSDANTLAAVLRTPIAYKPVAPSIYTQTYLSPGCAAWQTELQGALPTVFGNYTYLYLCPPNGPNWTSAQYQQQFHYINCHGGNNDPNFTGQSGTTYTTAMSSTLISGRLTNGMGCVAACCYSAKLYNPYATGPSPALPMPNTYLLSNAIFYMGSSVICYGGSAPYNVVKNANLAASSFANQILAGRSIGQAMLATWQAIAGDYTRSPSLVTLKTLVEFMAFGDATTVPIQVGPVTMSAEPAVRRLQDDLSLAAFEATARQLSRPIGRYVPLGETDVEADLRQRIDDLVRENGADPIALRSYVWQPPEEVSDESSRFAKLDRRIHIVFARTSADSIYDHDAVCEIFEADGQILSFDMYLRR